MPSKKKTYYYVTKGLLVPTLTQLPPHVGPKQCISKTDEGKGWVKVAEADIPKWFTYRP